jgi:hypothetical protein
MPESVSTVVTQIIEEGALDANSTTVLRWLNRRHKAMAARARSFRKTASVGPTVANQQDYVTPADLVVGLEVTVDGLTYGKARHTDKSQGAQNLLYLSGTGGIFFETADVAGVDSIGLYPVPTTAGLPILVYGAYRPPDLLLNDSVPFQVDDEAIEGLIAGVFATAMSRPNEARQDLAAGHEATFVNETEALRLREKRRLRGSGPAQIRVVGINA